MVTQLLLNTLIPFDTHAPRNLAPWCMNARYLVLTRAYKRREGMQLGKHIKIQTWAEECA